jgi:hypothetical protein
VSVETLDRLLLFGTLVPAVLSVAFFARVPWWRSEVGRHLFAYMSIVALMLLLGVAPLVWTPLPGWFEHVYRGCFGLFMAVTWWRLALILWEQRGVRLSRRVRDDADAEP